MRTALTMHQILKLLTQHITKKPPTKFKPSPGRHLVLFIQSLVLYSYSSREADTIPTDAIPTICSQDDPVHLYSLARLRLAHVEIVEIGKKLEWVEALDASKARH